MNPKAFFSQIWASCFRSATMAVAYAGTACGLIYANLDNMAGAVVDPSVVAYVHSVVDSHPTISKYTFAMFSMVVIAARLRTLIGKRP